MRKKSYYNNNNNNNNSGSISGGGSNANSSSMVNALISNIGIVFEQSFTKTHCESIMFNNYDRCFCLDQFPDSWM